MLKNEEIISKLEETAQILNKLPPKVSDRVATLEAATLQGMALK